MTMTQLSSTTPPAPPRWSVLRFFAGVLVGYVLAARVENEHLERLALRDRNGDGGTAGGLGR